MMKKLFLTTMLCFGIILANPWSIEACPQCHKAKDQKCKIAKLKGKVKLLWMHQDYLELTDAQLDQLKSIKHKAMKDIIQQKADVDIIKVDLKSAMYKDTIDLNAVNKLLDDKYAAKKKIAKTYVKALADIQNVLNEDQRAKAHEMMARASYGGKCPVPGCPHCPVSKGKFCPMTGKPIDGKGSPKGSM